MADDLKNGVNDAENTQATNNAQNSAPKGRSLKGAKTDTVAKAGIPIPAAKKLPAPTDIYPHGYEYPVAKLVRVSYDPAKDVKKNDVITPTPVLTFTYIDATGKQFTDVIFPIDEEEDEKFFKEVETLNQKMMHIWDETIGRNKFVENSMDGGDGEDDKENFKIMFDNICKAFNAHTVEIAGKEGQEAKKIPLYSTVPVYFKVTYYKDRLQVPKYPNWIQRAYDSKNQQVPCEFIINPTYDKLTAEAKVVNKENQNYGGARSNDFGGGGSPANGAFPDFPDLP